jgi:cellulose synthase/poly-beta-1,6-N-acetylglucosamine synthase-like glycosyltransferase
VRIAVLIPTWRRPDSLERCLDGLRHQHRVADEVIVVVREGDDETGRLLNGRQLESENLTVVTVTQPGVVAALNGGLAAVRDGIAAITDDDTVPRRDWLARVEKHFAGDPRLGGLGGRDWLHPPSGEPAQATVG